MSLPSQQEAMERANRGRRLLAAPVRLGRPKLRTDILGTFNVSMLEPLLVEALDRIGIPAHAKSGPFGQLEEEILNDASALYAAAPDAVVLVLSVEDLLAPLYARPASFLGSDVPQEGAEAGAGANRATDERDRRVGRAFARGYGLSRDCRNGSRAHDVRTRAG